MAIKYINIFQSRPLQNLPKLGLLAGKETIWQPCSKPTNQLVSDVHVKNIQHNPKCRFFSAEKMAIK
jgi:hypothetical protein